MCGPDGLGGQAVSAAFGQDKAADVLRPGPVLASLTAQAVAGADSLSDEELIGALISEDEASRLAALDDVAHVQRVKRDNTIELSRMAEGLSARGHEVDLYVPYYPRREYARARFGANDIDTPVYARNDLARGQTFEGPAIIEERETTIIILPGWRARVDATGCIMASKE